MRCGPARWCRAGLYGLALLACPLQAAVITVGPQESVRRIADAARLAKDGDTVLIQPGTYAGDVAVWRQKSLEIRGIGARPVLDARGTVAEGKAIWVFSDGDFKVSNIAFNRATCVRTSTGCWKQSGPAIERLPQRELLTLSNRNSIAGFPCR